MKESLSDVFLIFMNINKSQTEQDLFDFVRDTHRQIGDLHASDKSIEFACFLFVDGFNKDPRELIHIPEAVALLKRAYNAGFLSILYPSSMHFAQQMGTIMPAYGALELWLVVNDRIDLDRGRVQIDFSDTDKFATQVLPKEQRRFRQRLANYYRRRSGGGAS